MQDGTESGSESRATTRERGRESGGEGVGYRRCTGNGGGGMLNGGIFVKVGVREEEANYCSDRVWKPAVNVESVEFVRFFVDDLST